MEKGLLVLWVVQLTLCQTPDPLTWRQFLQTWMWGRKWTHPVHGPSGTGVLTSPALGTGTELFWLLPLSAVSGQRGTREDGLLVHGIPAASPHMACL